MIDSLGCVLAGKAGADLLFEDWTEVLGSERLTGATRWFSGLITDVEYC